MRNTQGQIISLPPFDPFAGSDSDEIPCTSHLSTLPLSALIAPKPSNGKNGLLDREIQTGRYTERSPDLAV